MKGMYNALRSAGLFVIILTLTLIVVIVGLRQIRAEAADKMARQVIKLNYFEGDWAFYLAEMETHITYYAHSGNPDEWTAYATARVNLSRVQQELEQDAAVRFTAEERELITTFNNQLTAVETAVTQVQQAVVAGEQRIAAGSLITVGASISATKKALGDLVAVSRGELNLATQEMPQQQIIMVTRITVAMGLLIVLAVWGFVVSAQVRQPIQALSNAVMAIGGGQFRPELLDDANALAPGILADKLTELAGRYEAEEARLQQELAAAQMELRQSRRQRMVDRVESTRT